MKKFKIVKFSNILHETKNLQFSLLFKYKIRIGKNVTLTLLLITQTDYLSKNLKQV